MKIKQEFLDTIISCPLTRKEISVRFIDPKLYSIYHSKGYSFLFQDEKTEVKIESEKTEIKTQKIKKDDIS